MRRLLLALPLACDPSAAAEPDPEQPPVEFTCQHGAHADPFIDCIESFAPQAATFGQDRMPGVVLGPPEPGAPGMGGLDVLSLGCGGEVTVYFDDPAIVDGPGPDFIVFENALAAGATVFVEPARVYVSPDGLDWYAFPCVPGGDADGCAGRTPVTLGADPTDPAAAGGDAFDLADLGLDRARYVRLVDVGEAHYGDRMWCGSGNGGFDLDAIAVVHAPG